MISTAYGPSELVISVAGPLGDDAVEQLRDVLETAPIDHAICVDLRRCTYLSELAMSLLASTRWIRDDETFVVAVPHEGPVADYIHANGHAGRLDSYAT